MKSNSIKKNGKRGGKRPGSGRKPGSINKATADLKGMARQYSAQALTILAELMQDPEVPPAARIQAAREVLDRGYGKPTQSLDISGEIKPVDTAELDRIYERNMAKVAEYARLVENRKRLLKEGVWH
ncbi:MAG: hypothetical protein ACXWUD_10885 [Methylosarcina sp.]